VGKEGGEEGSLNPSLDKWRKLFIAGNVEKTGTAKVG
jgi:hypothetical protein